jgi:hypothetical protein
MPLGPFNPVFGGNGVANGSTHISAFISGIIGYQAPPNAIAFLFQTSDGNTINVRWNVSFAASFAVGHQYQGGRDSGYIPFSGSTFSVIPETDGITCGIQLSWFIQS